MKKNKQQQTKIDKIVERGYKQLDKFYNCKLKNKKYLKITQYMNDAKIDSSLKSF
jgi:hypothetical protein